LLILITKDRNGDVGKIGDPESKGENPHKLARGERNIHQGGVFGDGQGGGSADEERKRM
jgi:hypothetical protein